MQILTIIGFVIGAVGFIAFVVAAVVVVKSTKSKTNQQIQDDLIDTLMKSKVIQEDQIKELTEKSGNLQGQIDVFKTLPLKEISSDLKQIAKDQRAIAGHTETTAKTQSDIIELLGNKPKTA